MDLHHQDAEKEFLGRFNSPKQAEETHIDGWGGFGGYMKAKNFKLNKQQQETFVRKSNIFKGVSIWVNGYTNPSSDELKRMMIEHGGQYQHFFSKTLVTHIIATNLPDSKIKDLKRNDKVVKPEWVLDSVKANRLLSIDKYLLYSVNKRDGTELRFNTVRKKEIIDSGIDDRVTEELTENSIFKELPVLTKHTYSSVPVNPCNDNVSDNRSFEDTEAPVLSKHTYSSCSKSTRPAKAGDDNFISEFYSHSRLHHLAMWKAELKKFALSIQQKRKKEQPSSIGNNKDKLIMHVDLDSFFVSVSLKLNPELKGNPVAVCHSGRSQKDGKNYENSWSEIASCSYEARHFGLRNGMMLRAAKQLCPSLICVPYQFEEYRNVSQSFYEILSSYTPEIEAVSCDEALLDVTSLISNQEDVTALAEKIRGDIYKKTGCTASCGISNSILIARLATKRAKPDGFCFIAPKDVPQFIVKQNATDLPGVGRAHGKVFQANNIQTCNDLQQWSLQALRKEFGQKHGEMLYNFCRGKDNRPLKMDQERKSVSAEINYGMRFTKNEEVAKFVKDLSEEVEKRLREIRKKGLQISLKLMTKRQDGEPVKFLGHGICDSLSRSITLPTPTDDKEVIEKSVLSVLRGLQIQPSDIRGMGIQVTKLSEAVTVGPTKNLLQFTKVQTPEELHQRDSVLHTVENNQKHSEVNKLPMSKSTNQGSKLLPITSFLGPCPTLNKFDDLPPTELPPLPNVVLDAAQPGPSSRVPALIQTQGQNTNWDPDVFKELPHYIQLELKAQQSARPDILKVGTSPSEKNKTFGKDFSTKTSGKQPVKAAGKRGRGRGRKLYQHRNSPSKTVVPKNKPGIPKAPPSILETNTRTLIGERNDSGFISPTQVNFDVLNELPEEIRNEVLLEFKKSKHYLREKNRNSTKSSFDNKKTKERNLPNDEKQSIMEMNQDTAEDTIETSSTAIPTIMSPQLDQSFLRAIPEDMRNEILEAKAAKQKRTIDSVGINNENEITDKGYLLNPRSLVKELEVLSTSQFDKSVMNSLPKDIREELENEPGLQYNTRTSFGIRNIDDRNNSMDVPCLSADMQQYRIQKNIEDHINYEANLPASKRKLIQVLPELRGVSSCRDIRKLIRSWMDEFPDYPLEEDVVEICDYFKKLLSSYNLETLFVLLKFMRRMIADMPTWQEPYNRILGNLQKEMTNCYNGSLPINPFNLEAC